MHVVAVGGSDAGISAALRARELDSGSEVTVVVADAYPNYSICGIPYHVSGDVDRWSDLAHRSIADLEAAGICLELDTRATAIDVPGRSLHVTGPDGRPRVLGYDALIVGTGAVSIRPRIPGLTGPEALGTGDGVHLLHSMGDMFALMATITHHRPRTAVVIGAGYIGLEMAEALTTRGLQVTQLEALPEVLPTVDPDLGTLVHQELADHGVQVHTATTVTRLARDHDGLRVEAIGPTGDPLTLRADLVLVVVGVRPDTDLLAAAGARLGVKSAIAVDPGMRTSLPGIYAAGDCVVTYHRLLGASWLPLGTTAHKQGRVAGENAVGGDRRFAGSLGTQVVKVFDVVTARTGLRDHEARSADAGWTPVTTASAPDDHKAYYPGATPIAVRVTGDTGTGRLLGAQLVGRRSAEISKRVDTYATALFHGMTVDDISDLDLSYTPPLGSPWDAIQIATQTWTREHPAPAQPPTGATETSPAGSPAAASPLNAPATIR
jgi:NADPH-dependent 2,4-dienoyl-CoA reductase/sulfur reductase-like enzyme